MPDPRTVMPGDTDLFQEKERLRAALRVVTDNLALLLEAGRFPAKGRSQDDKDSTEGWWEDHVASVRQAYSVLAGLEEVGPWEDAHPGLYIPPPGPITLDE